MTQQTPATVLARFDPSTSKWGLWTLVGTWGLSLLAGLRGGGFGPLWDSLFRFLTGQATQLHQSAASPAHLITLTGVFLTVALPVAYAVAKLSCLRLGDTDNALSRLFDGFGEKNYFRGIFLMVLVEELFARWLFLGVIGHFWAGRLALYTLFILGNSLWALVHLLNVSDPSKRRPLQVLTQFVTGVLLTVIFLQFGFMAVLLAHFAFDALVFCSHKRQVWGRSSGFTVAYHGLLVAGSYAVMQTVTHTHLAALGSWLTSQPTLAIPGWGLVDYVLSATLVISLIAIGLELLAYDQNNLTPVGQDRPGWVVNFIGTMLLVLIALGLFWGLGLVMTSVPHRIMVVAFLVMLVEVGMSGSAMARSFWQGLPSLYLTLCCVLGLGFWGAVAFLLLRQVLEVPERLIVLDTTEVVTRSRPSVKTS